MQVQLVLTLAASFLMAPVPKDETKDAQAIQGTWVVVSAEKEGRATNEINGDKVIFKDGNLTVKTKNKEEKATYKIDPSKKPRTLDITPEKENDVILGIYQLEGDTLKICFAEKAARPTDFNSKGDRRMLIVLKRQKK
jgi:uncharacterized protein (TIGR03067 family)